ncbi:hypothetical protein HK097_011416 [Rhizophlyctis rosea]|uniref:DSBA-like thioredoxin domain-containing protein n=1 Tax=Rhizophlyctis rosea TaxID=64517 RepID=A0AAD5X335_9FUNG|nr:hypothetical protein HK097_011416 [Rhizophlyctis rosea]
MASAKRLVKIDVVSDNICPWCFVGKRRLEKAIAQARQKNLPLDFQVNFKPFQLDATLPVEGKDKLAHYKSKFGAARMDQMIPFMEGIGKKEGITFSYGGVIANTINSHRLVALAEKKGLQDQTVEELFKTYFEKNDNIGDLNVLADVGAKVGLDKEEVR